MWTNTDDAVLATVDAIKAICGVLAAESATTSDLLAQSFRQQGAIYLEKRNPDGAVVMDMLLAHLGSQEAALRLAKLKSQGTA